MIIVIKKNLFWCILLVFLLNAVSSYASINAKHTCVDARCREGTDIKFSVEVYNNINKSITVEEIAIRDFDYDKTYYVYDNDDVVLKPQESIIINFTDKVKAAANGGYTINYVPCFKTSIFDSSGKIEGTGKVCDNAIKNLNLLPLSNIECEKNEDCSKDEYCDTRFFRCKKTENETIEEFEDFIIKTKQLDNNTKFVDIQKKVNPKWESFKYWVLTIIVMLFVIYAIYEIFYREEIKDKEAKRKKKPRKR